MTTKKAETGKKPGNQTPNTPDFSESEAPRQGGEVWIPATCRAIRRRALPTSARATATGKNDAGR
jgi:hypothetical protein